MKMIIMKIMCLASWIITFILAIRENNLAMCTTWLGMFLIYVICTDGDNVIEYTDEGIGLFANKVFLPKEK